MKKPLFFLLFLLTLSASVNAQDFIATGQPDIKVVQCDSLTSELNVLNTRQQTANYAISVGGNGADFVKFSDITFTLNPQDTQLITVFYEIPCDSKPKNYQVEIYFDDGVLEQELIQTLKVTKPISLEVKTKTPSQLISPCADAAYNITVLNPSNFTEIYDLKVNGHKDAKISPDTLVVIGNSSKTVTVQVQPQDCSEFGTFVLNTNIQTQKTEQEANLELELIITQSDILKIGDQITKTIKTGYTDSITEVQLENTGDRTTKYQLTLDSPSWITLLTEEITLKSGEKQTVQLRFNPEENQKSGKEKITISAVVQATGVQYSKEFTVNLKKPSIIKTYPITSTILLIIFLLLCALIAGGIWLIRQPKFQLQYETWKTNREIKKEQKQAKRQARKDRRAKIRAQAKQRRDEAKDAKLQAKKLKQEAKQARIEAKLATRHAKELRRAQIITEKAQMRKQLVKKAAKQEQRTSSQQAFEQSNGKSIFLAALSVFILILVAIFWNIIAPNLTYVIVGLAILFTLFILKKLSRIKKIVQKLKKLNSKEKRKLTFWRCGLHEIEATTKEDIHFYSIRALKVKAKLQPNGKVFQSIQITQNANATLNATFAIPKCFLKKNRIDVTNLKIGRLNGMSWRSTQATQVAEDKKYVYFQTDVSKEGVYSIYGKQSPKPLKKPCKKMTIFFGTIGLLILAALAGALVSPANVQGAIPPQTWTSGTTHKIALGEFFNDPDGDQLQYTATGNNQITIDFVKNTAILTPKEGFAGEELVKFVASDGTTKVSSNSVPLRVKKTVLYLFAKPLAYLILLLLAGLIIFWMSKRLQKNN